LREVREETGLTVEVVRLLWEQEFPDGRGYRRAKTYLCRWVAGVAAPGAEPELDHHLIEEIGWFLLNDREHWGAAILNDPKTSSFLDTLRKVLDSERS
jgi:8-oxo-dGTP pyrophosphatase MutT (NUDIX family)